jgi:hypothetical protein
VRCEASLPILSLADLLVPILESTFAFLRQIVLAKKTATTIGDDPPNDTIAGAERFSADVYPRHRGTEIDDFADNLMTQYARYWPAPSP